MFSTFLEVARTIYTVDWSTKTPQRKYPRSGILTHQVDLAQSNHQDYAAVAAKLDVRVSVTNSTGASIAADSLVYAPSYNTTNYELNVAKAQATAAGLPAVLITDAAIANGAQGYAVRSKILTSCNTNAGTVGDPIYLSDGTAGAWTLTKPTLTDNPQIVGYIITKHATTGRILITLPGQEQIVHTHTSNAEGGATLTSPTITSPVLTTPQINDTSADHQYVFAVSELAADRTVTLPLLAANDTFVFKTHADTLAGKTLTTPTIADFTNATHAHNAAASGGLVAAWIPLPLTTWREVGTNDIQNLAAHGGILAKDSTPILEYTNGDTDSALRLDWAASDSNAVVTQVALPPDLDAASAVEVHFRAAMAGTTDSPDMDLDTFFNEGDTKVEDAVNVTGTSYAEYTITIAAADVPAGAQTASLELTPAAHTTDALYVTAIWIEYTRA